MPSWSLIKIVNVALCLSS